MIGHHDSRRTDINGTLRVRDAHDPLETELLAPFFTDLLGVLPIHRLVEHCAEIVSDRYRHVRTLFDVVLQERQLEPIVREMIYGPSRMQGKADEAFESQARW